MKLQNIAISAGVLGLSVFAFSLSRGASTTTAAAEEPKAQPQVTQPEPKRFGEHNMIAPLYLTLEKGTTDAGGETTVVAHIQTNGTIRYPVSMELTAPPRDGVITQGARTEVLDLSQGGNVDRVFKIKAPSGLDANNAFKVVVKGGNEKLGFYAEKQWPPAAELTVPPHAGPMPPTGRPPMLAPPKLPGIANPG